MNNGIPHVPLGDVLSKSDEWVDLDPAHTYQQVTIKMWGQGVVQRNEVSGAEIAASRRLKVRAGQFILSRIDARNGALGLVPEILHGAVVSNDFPAFNVNTSRIMPEYLGWMSKTHSFVELCKAASEGTTNRVRLQEDLFLALHIPLPPLAEQRRIVARIEELAAKIEEARGLRRIGLEETGYILSRYLDRLFGNPYTNVIGEFGITHFSRMDEAVTDVADGPHVTPIYVVEGIPFVTVLNITSGRVNFSGLKYITLEEHQQFQRRARAERGDVLISKDGTIGIPCYIDTDREFSFFVSVALVKPRRDILDGEFLTWALRTPYLQARMRQRSRGDMIRHLVLREIRDLTIPTPPVDEQRRIVSYLDSLQAKVDALKALQAETQAELDAMLPAVLDKAFKGEL